MLERAYSERGINDNNKGDSAGFGGHGNQCPVRERLFHRGDYPMSNQSNNARTSLQGVSLFIFINAFLIGTASGLRALIGLAAVSWAARLGILPLGHTWLAFLGYAFTPYILTLMAIGELVNDKLPKTPSRLIPPQFITRIVTSALCGLAIGLSGDGMIVGLVAGVIGALAGTFGGAKARSFLARTFGRDLPAALLEDAVAFGIAAFALVR